MSKKARLSMMEKDNAELSIKEQATLLSVNRTNVYYSKRTKENLYLKKRISAIFEKHPYYGHRRVKIALSRDGIIANRKKVIKLMKQLGIAAIVPGPNLSKRAHKDRIESYLLKGLKINRSNQVWSIDITYIRLKKGWVYLVAIVDWFSRYIVGYKISITLETSFVTETVEEAITLYGKPEIINSDQGSQFTSLEYKELLKINKIKQSMDGKGRAIDNVMVERVFRSIKYEAIYINGYETVEEVREGIDKYVLYYNNQRPHKSLGYKTPEQVYHKAFI